MAVEIIMAMTNVETLISDAASKYINAESITKILT